VLVSCIALPILNNSVHYLSKKEKGRRERGRKEGKK
jgi:hypothetical protein